METRRRTRRRKRKGQSFSHRSPGGTIDKNEPQQTKRSLERRRGGVRSIRSEWTVPNWAWASNNCGRFQPWIKCISRCSSGERKWQLYSTLIETVWSSGGGALSICNTRNASHGEHRPSGRGGHEHAASRARDWKGICIHRKKTTGCCQELKNMRACNRTTCVTKMLRNEKKETGIDAESSSTAWTEG